jgi:hypothetical protein
VKVPLRVTGIAVLKLIDLGLTVADKVSTWWQKRGDSGGEPLTYKDVANIERQIEKATRSRAPTVVLPRRPPPPPPRKG